jgi:predicted transposase YdaD
MALSQTYLAWEKQKKQEGREQGREQGQLIERRSTIVNLMQLRYGEISPALEACIPHLMALSSEDYTRLLLQLSQAELIQHFEN